MSSNDGTQKYPPKNSTFKAILNEAHNADRTVKKSELRLVVQHNYHDYATESSIEFSDDNEILPRLTVKSDSNSIFFDNNQPSSILATTLTSSHKSRTLASCVAAFPKTLYNLLEEAEGCGYETIVSWQEHGRAFRVHNQRMFVEIVMPQFFQQTKFTSFQRQLALYGFIRLTRKGKDFGAYYNEKFLRGYPQLLCSIQRTPFKGTWVQKIPSPETEPDFYDMPPVHRKTNRKEAEKVPHLDEKRSRLQRPIRSNSERAEQSNTFYYVTKPNLQQSQSWTFGTNDLFLESNKSSSHVNQSMLYALPETRLIKSVSAPTQNATEFLYQNDPPTPQRSYWNAASDLQYKTEESFDTSARLDKYSSQSEVRSSHDFQSFPGSSTFGEFMYRSQATNNELKFKMNRNEIPVGSRDFKEINLSFPKSPLLYNTPDIIQNQGIEALRNHSVVVDGLNNLYPSQSVRSQGRLRLQMNDNMAPVSTQSLMESCSNYANDTLIESDRYNSSSLRKIDYTIQNQRIVRSDPGMMARFNNFGHDSYQVAHVKNEIGLKANRNEIPKYSRNLMEIKSYNMEDTLSVNVEHNTSSIREFDNVRQTKSTGIEHVYHSRVIDDEVNNIYNDPLLGNFYTGSDRNRTIIEHKKNQIVDTEQKPLIPENSWETKRNASLEPRSIEEYSRRNKGDLEDDIDISSMVDFLSNIDMEADDF